MKNKKIFREMSKEITNNLLSSLKNNRIESNDKEENLWQMLIEELTTQAIKEIKKELGREDFLEDKRFEINGRNTEEGLIKADEKLEKINRKLSGEQTEDEDEDEIKGADSDYPNLKYAQPKYKNLESVLKYIESKDDKGGVKLVIMNFND